MRPKGDNDNDDFHYSYSFFLSFHSFMLSMMIFHSFIHSFILSFFHYALGTPRRVQPNRVGASVELAQPKGLQAMQLHDCSKSTSNANLSGKHPSKSRQLVSKKLESWCLAGLTAGTPWSSAVRPAKERQVQAKDNLYIYMAASCLSLY